MYPPKSKNRTLVDIYLQSYPYKKNDNFIGNTIPNPYIKQDDISNHRLALSYKEWLSIMEQIIIEIKSDLYDGDVWDIGSGLGKLHLAKMKCRKFLDRINSAKEKKAIYTSRNDFDNYMLVPEWNRKKAPFKHKWLWRFKFAVSLLRPIYQTEDTNIIYKFLDK